MATARTNRLPHLSRYVIRPALAEARLLNAKHANDPVYLCTIAEELRNVEKQVATLEIALRPRPTATQVEVTADTASADLPDIEWIHTKSAELSRRLQRIEELSK